MILIIQQSFGQQNCKREVTLMGSNFEFAIVADSEKLGHNYIDIAIDEIERIEKLISSWDPNSQTSQINRNAGIKPVSVAVELFSLIERSIQISKITEGAFDISYAAMDRLWKFDGNMSEKPSEESIKKSIALVGFEQIQLDRATNSVYLKKRGMKIGFGAIGKGYAADKAKELLMSRGVTAGIINASGDLNAWGTQSDGSDWIVGITNPLNRDKMFSWLPIKNRAVVTSGDYEKYVVFDNVRYAHIINPKTGYPTTGVKSVSIFAPKAELADALATAVFVMGVDSGLYFIDQLKGIEVIIVDDDNQFHTSNNLEFNREIK